MSTVAQSQVEPCPELLSEDQVEQFRRQGFLAFQGVLTPEEVEASRQAFTRVAGELSKDPRSVFEPSREKEDGTRSGATYQRPDSRSFIQFEAGYDPVDRPVEELELKIRKYMWFKDEDPVFQQMVSPGSRLHGVVESLIGTDPILFQEMALVKPPFVGREKPWHQDNAYFSVAPLDRVMGVWLALDDATVENGCMHVIPGGHLSGGFRHHHGMDCEIDPELLPTSEVVPVPVPAGGALFFVGMLPHETPPNRSAQRRRALQFHFRGADTKIVDEETYDRLFIDRTGQPASCRAASRHGF